MKRVTALLIILSLGALVANVPANAAPRRKHKRVERTVEASYATPAAGVALAGDFYAACKHGDGIGCVKITPEPKELFARVAITDTTDLPVHGFITNIDASTVIADFCGETRDTVFLGSGDEFLVWAFAGPCSDGTPAMATSGTVTVVLSNRP